MFMTAIIAILLFLILVSTPGGRATLSGFKIGKTRLIEAGTKANQDKKQTC
jgi:hypothetical protein